MVPRSHLSRFIHPLSSAYLGSGCDGSRLSRLCSPALIQLLLGDPEAFSGQMRYVMHPANSGSAHRSLSLLVVRNLQKGGSYTTSAGSFLHEEAAVLRQAPCGCLNTLISKAERSYPSVETPWPTSPTVPYLQATLKRLVNQESPMISRASKISERI